MGVLVNSEPAEDKYIQKIDVIHGASCVKRRKAVRGFPPRFVLFLVYSVNCRLEFGIIVGVRREQVGEVENEHQHGQQGAFVVFFLNGFFSKFLNELSIFYHHVAILLILTKRQKLQLKYLFALYHFPLLSLGAEQERPRAIKPLLSSVSAKISRLLFARYSAHTLRPAIP